jgi:hypothetical protein
LLAITAAHAYEIATPYAPTTVFESYVAAAVIGRNLDTLNFAEVRRGHASFDAALLAEGPSIGLRPTPEVAARKRRAVDEKGDVIAHMNWHDIRSDSWTWVGQATCAKSDEWEHKIIETSGPHWQDYLGVVVPPAVFLAVPHHAEPEALRYVTSGSGRVLLDRLRLASARSDVAEHEAAIYGAVSATEWARP